ncbi:MAG: methyl-accepting chemotaxis protein, partial [Chitinimonas sp.]|nr:methyl-accepting chemotaxis protein [Chitinimonas sp.]
MYQLRLRSLFIWLTAASLLLVLLILFTLGRLSAAIDELSQAQANRYQSYLLADTLRQSSDDLTRLARTYVVTGDPAYERQYWDVIAIRNGDKPLPEAYHRIYWDFVAAGEAKPRPDGRPVALLDMMKAAGFSEAEFAKLNEAKANSDGLVKTETIAMNAV